MAEGEGGGAIAGADRGPAARVHEFLAAARYLTVGGRDSPANLEEVARGAAFFPALGLVLGATAYLLAGAVAAFSGPAQVAFLVLVALTAVTAAALPRGLIRACGELSLVRSGPRWVAVSLGISAAALSTSAKWWAIADTPLGGLGLSLPLAVMLGRWAFVVQAYGSQSGEESGAGAIFPRAMEFREFSFASVFAMATCLVLADAIGLIFLLWTAVQTVVVRIAVHRWCGGVTRHTLAAGAELAETAALLLAAALARTLLSV